MVVQVDLVLLLLGIEYNSGYVTSSPASTNGHRGGSGLVLIAYPS